MVQYDEHLDWLVPFDMRIDDIDARVEMGEKIRDMYTGGKPLADNLGAGVRVSENNSIDNYSHIVKSSFCTLFLYAFLLLLHEFELEGRELKALF